MAKAKAAALFAAMSFVSAMGQSSGAAGDDLMKDVAHLKDFQAIELRRYTIKEGRREDFARYFDGYFPEAFQQLGAIAFGEFFERDKVDGFTWFRGFHTMDDRAKVNSAFYYGPVWKEHKKTLNDLMIDSDNVLLLRPLNAQTEIPVLPAVDPLREPEGAQGIVVAQIFAVKPGSIESFAAKAEAVFMGYRTEGLREAGVLVTLDAPNNFPQLPVRTDGPYLVWLGVLRDKQVLEERLRSAIDRSNQTFAATGLLRAPPEVVVLTPSKRSRLRWLPGW
jgi:hypothetical protein